MEALQCSTAELRTTACSFAACRLAAAPPTPPPQPCPPLSPPGSAVAPRLLGPCCTRKVGSHAWWCPCAWARRQRQVSLHQWTGGKWTRAAGSSCHLLGPHCRRLRPRWWQLCFRDSSSKRSRGAGHGRARRHPPDYTAAPLAAARSAPSAAPCCSCSTPPSARSITHTALHICPASAV